MRISDWSSDVCSSDLLAFAVCSAVGMVLIPQAVSQAASNAGSRTLTRRRTGMSGFPSVDVPVNKAGLRGTNDRSNRASTFAQLAFAIKMQQIGRAHV